MDINVILEKLESLPHQIKENEITKYELVLDKIDIEKQISLIENDIKQKINNALDDKGKKLYSNESARKMKFEEDSAVNESLIQKRDELFKIEDKIFSLTNEYGYLHSTQTNLRAILNYYTSQNKS